MMSDEPPKKDGRVEEHPKTTRHKYEKQLRLNPKDSKIMMGAYEDYCQVCSQSYTPIVAFNKFMKDMALIGFYQWKQKNKRA